MKHFLALLIAGALMVPLAAHATDGDRLASSGNTSLAAQSSNSNKGVAIVSRFLLCDGDPGAGTKLCSISNAICTGSGAPAPCCSGSGTGTCPGVFDLYSLGLGMPTEAVFGFVRGPSCTGADTVTPRGADMADLSVMYDLGPVGSTTLTTGAQMVVVPVQNRYLTALITDTDGSCTDAEVTIQLLFNKGDAEVP